MKKHKCDGGDDYGIVDCFGCEREMLSHLKPQEQTEATHKYALSRFPGKGKEGRDWYCNNCGEFLAVERKDVDLNEHKCEEQAEAKTMPNSKQKMSLKRFLEIWKLKLNESNYRYENERLSIDYLFIKTHDHEGDIAEVSFELTKKMNTIL